MKGAVHCSDELMNYLRTEWQGLAEAYGILQTDTNLNFFTYNTCIKIGPYAQCSIVSTILYLYS